MDWNAHISCANGFASAAKVDLLHLELSRYSESIEHIDRHSDQSGYSGREQKHEEILAQIQLCLTRIEDIRELN